MTFTYDPTSLSSDLAQVRLIIGDTSSANAQFQDEEINLALAQRGSTYGASAFLCRALATRYAKEADTVDRDLRTTYSQRSTAYLRMATDYEKQASVEPGGAAILVAGLPPCLSQAQ